MGHDEAALLFRFFFPWNADFVFSLIPEAALVIMSQDPPPETCATADTLRMEMEPLTFSQQESVDLEEFLDDTLFSFPLEEQQWVGSLLDEAFQDDISIPFDDFGNDYAPAFLDEIVSNPQISDGGSATASGNGNGSVSDVDESNGEMTSEAHPPSSSSPPSPADSLSDQSTVVVEDDQRKRKR